ncbi:MULTISPECIES: metallophosphoesterase family protein [unclassified Flavobacterium]|jgi:putative phosphoesterase|uniref:metallophosphoesterase family protein n=1 Tax=unclassified Flavobacterium TaxID=196869 RepID=UPI0025BC6FE0|nr:MULTISPECIES: metallophosphoesterase family protein [unclassified Flavobacterium]
MKIAIFGDVHGNLIALEKFFKLEKDTTDLFISHGDIVNYGPWSNECVQFLNDQTNCKVLKGNHEQFYLKGNYGGNNIIAKTFFEKCFENFNANLLDIIKKYDEKIVIDDYTIQHTINDSYIFSDTKLDDIVLDSNYIIGHSHQQFQRTVGNKLLINTGSIGQNRQYLNQSCYLKLDTNTKKITLKSFLHDIDKVINQMKSDNYPEICLDYYLSKQKVIF